MELEVNFEPHFNVLTRSGKAHFSNIKDAVCELVDNSIQATNLNSIENDRTIRIFIILGNTVGTSFLVVWDNGCGMDTQGIREFATYFLGQEERGLAPSQSEVMNKKHEIFGASGKISKFGVGAIQAGFYIGKSLTVVTRKVNSDNDNVLEFTMDEDKFKDRTTGKVFQDRIKIRKPYNINHNHSSSSSSSSHNDQNDDHDVRLQSLWQAAIDQKFELNRSELSKSGGNGFTYVALRLREEHEKYFRDTAGAASRLGKQLSHTYHYYLKPLNSSSTASSSSSPLSLSGSNKKKEDDNQQAVTMEVFSKGHVVSIDRGVYNYSKEGEWFKLNELKGLEYYYLKNAARVFPFALSLEHRDDNGNLMQHQVHGEVRYYPHNGSKETMPNRHSPGDDDEPINMIDDNDANDGEDEEDNDEEDNQPFQQFRFDKTKNGYNPHSLKKTHSTQDVAPLTQLGGTQQSSLTQHINENENDDFLHSNNQKASHLFDIYWSHRLIPETRLNILPFFPTDHWIVEHRNEIGPMWLNRLHGSIFFDWHFPISNNKLRLLAKHENEPAGGAQMSSPQVTTGGGDGLAELIQDTELTQWDGRLQQLRNKFANFLLECHALDKDTTFHNPISVGDLEPPNTKTFLSMTFGALGSSGETFQKGELVQVFPGKSKSKRSITVLGELLYFIAAPNQTGLNTEQVQGRGTFKLKRLPESIWGDTIEVFDVGLLHSAAKKLDNKEFKKEIEKVDKELPRHTHVSLYPDPKNEHYFISSPSMNSTGTYKNMKKSSKSSTKADEVNDGHLIQREFIEGKSTDIIAGEQQIALIIKILNGNKKLVTKQPGSGGGSSWVVRISLIAPNGKTTFEHVSGHARKLMIGSENGGILKVASQRNKNDKNNNSNNNNHTQLSAMPGEMVHSFNGFDIFKVGKHTLVVEVLKKIPSSSSSSSSHSRQKGTQQKSYMNELDESNNVVYRYQHVFNVMPSHPIEMTSIWKQLKPSSSSSSSLLSSSQEAIPIRLGEPFPPIELKLQDAYHNYIDETTLLRLTGKQAKQSFIERKTLSQSMSQHIKELDSLPIEFISLELNASNFEFNYDDCDAAPIKLSENTNIVNNNNDDDDEGNGLNDSSNEPSFECGGVLGQDYWVITPSEMSSLDPHRKEGGKLVKVKVALFVTLDNPNTDSNPIYDSAESVTKTEEGYQIKLQSTLLLSVFPGMPKLMKLMSPHMESSNPTLTMVDGTYLPDLSFGVLDQWENFTFPMKKDDPNEENKLNHKKKQKKSNKFNKNKELNEIEQWKVKLNLLNNENNESIQFNKNGKKEKIFSWVSLSNGLSEFSKLGISIPLQVWSLTNTQQAVSNESLNLQLQSQLSICNQPGNQDDEEGEEVNICESMIGLIVKANDAPTSCNSFYGNMCFDSKFQVAGSVFQSPDIKCYDGIGRPVLVSEIIAKAKLCSEEKASQKKVPFSGVLYLKNDKEIYNKEWKDMLSDDYAILLPDVKLSNKIIENHEKVKFEVKVILPYFQNEESDILVTQFSVMLESGPPTKWGFGFTNDNDDDDDNGNDDDDDDGGGDDNDDDGPKKKKQKKSKKTTTKKKLVKKEISVGTPLHQVLNHVYLMDKHKNKVTSARWLELYKPKVTIRNHDIQNPKEFDIQHTGCIECSAAIVKKGMGQFGEYLIPRDEVILNGKAPGKCVITVETDEVCIPLNEKQKMKKMDNDEEDEDDDDATDNDEEFSYKTIEGNKKSFNLFPGPPCSIQLRAKSLFGCDTWSYKLEAEGELLGGHPLDDLQLQLLDVAKNVRSLYGEESVELAVELGGGGVLKVPLTCKNYQRNDDNDGTIFQFPKLYLTKPSSPPPNKKKKKKSYSSSTSAADDVLVNVKGTMINLSTLTISNNINTETEPYDLSSAMLCGNVKAVNKVNKISCRLLHSVAGAPRDLCSYGDSGEEFASHVLSNDQSKPPALLVTCFNEDGSPYLPLPTPASEHAMVDDNVELDDNELIKSLKLTCTSSSSSSGNKKASKKRKTILDLYEGPKFHTNEQGEVIGIVFHPLSKTSHQQAIQEDNQEEEEEDEQNLGVGDYVFCLQYREQRGEVLRAFQGGTQGILVGDDATQIDEAELRVEANFTLRVVSGSPVTLQLTKQISDIFVSDGEDSTPRKIPTLVLSMLDRSAISCSEAGLEHLRWGPLCAESSQNATAVPSCSSIQVRCRLIRDSSSESSSGYDINDESMLKLEGCDEAGWLKQEVEWRSSGNKFTFNQLVVQNNPLAVDGSYKLHFEVFFGESLLDTTTANLMTSKVQPLEVSVILSTDKQRLEEEKAKQILIEKMEKDLEPSKRKRDDLLAQRQDLASEVDTFACSVRDSASHIPTTFRELIMGVHSQSVSSASTQGFPSSAEVESNLDRWRKELSERTRVSSEGLAGQRRPAVMANKSEHPEFRAQVNSLNPRGRLVDLVFVEDARVAELVSWHFQSRMPAVVVQTRKQNEQCYKLGAKSWALDLLNPFPGEKGDKELKLPKQGWPGEAKYLINELQLLDKDEDLRATLLYKLVQSTLLFENMKDMNDYRQWCAKHKKNHPMLLVRDEGTKCGSDGMLDPNATLDRYKENNMKHNKKHGINFVFGSLPEGESNDVKLLADACQYGSELLLNINQYQEKKILLNEFIENHENDLNELEIKTDEMEKEIRNLKGISEPKIPKKKKARR